MKDALGLGAATIDVAYTGMNSAIDVTKEIKNKLVAARQPGIDRDKVQSEITELQNQLQSIGNSAVFSGQNWLSVEFSRRRLQRVQVDCRLVLTRSGGAVSIGTITVDTSGMTLYDAGAAATEAGILDGLRDTTGAIGSDAAPFSIVTLDISALTDSAADLDDP